uniref:Uncharacterized protein n=1 Tax=Triticum urartu TaxID=4572 RepID=A0A8R7UTC2_TRIUA
MYEVGTWKWKSPWQKQECDRKQADEVLLQKLTGVWKIVKLLKIWKTYD